MVQNGAKQYKMVQNWSSTFFKIWEPSASPGGFPPELVLPTDLLPPQLHLAYREKHGHRCPVSRWVWNAPACSTPQSPEPYDSTAAKRQCGGGHGSGFSAILPLQGSG